MGASNEATGAVWTFATQFIDGAFVEASAQLSADGREAVVASFPPEFRQGAMDADEALEQYWIGLYGQYGSAEDVDEVTIDDGTATVRFRFEDGTETARVEFGPDGVTALSFAPEYSVPPYADGDALSERAVEVDAGDVSLDGVLTLPDGDGPLPGVVLVHGAGINDPDGTAGATKILKDLAWGLATEGIATLRYEKRLAAHDVPEQRFTLDTVVTDDAVAAVDTLAAAGEVADDALFVAGHSQGGMCAPQVAERHGGVAGVVNLDGSADPVLDPADADIIRYEYELDGDLDEEQAAQLESDRETLRRIADGEFEDDETLMGRPGVWHRSTKAYDPVSTASSLDAPVFALNAGNVDRETQPALDSYLRADYEAWRDADLPAGSRVEFYADLDHYFQPGHVPSGPMSLYFGGNVAEPVLADLVEWIRGIVPSASEVA